MIDHDRILTLHPQGRKGVHILRCNYDVIKDYILNIMHRKGVISYQDLNDWAIQDLSNTFDGKVPWYVVSVKLDLEARGIIEHIPGTTPHQIRLKK